MKTPLPEVCYGLLDIEMADPSVKEVTPIIIKRGETGYYKTDWTWQKEYAKECLDKKNKSLGVGPETAELMQGYSMFGWPADDRMITQNNSCL